MAGVRCDSVGDIQGSIETGLGLHHLGHQSEFKRGCRINRVPGQCHDAGARHSYYARQEPGTTISRDNSQFDETLCECCSFRGYSDVTHTGEIKSGANRSEEHTSELQSLMRISYAVFCLKKKTNESSPYNQNSNNYNT